MAVVTLNAYDIFRKNLYNGTSTIDFDTDTIKAAVVKSTYTPNQNTHDYWDDVSATEVTGTGYSAGGQTLANGTVTMDGSGNITVDLNNAADIAQNAAGFSDGRRVVIYKSTGVSSTSPLIAYSDDFGSNKGNVDGVFSITVNASGLITHGR